MESKELSMNAKNESIRRRLADIETTLIDLMVITTVSVNFENMKIQNA